MLTAAQHNLRVPSESDDKIATEREGGERTLRILAGASQGSAARYETRMRQLLSAAEYTGNERRAQQRGHLFSTDDGLSGI